MSRKRNTMPLFAMGFLLLLSLACGGSASPIIESAVSTETKLAEVVPTDTTVATIAPTETYVPTIAPPNTPQPTETTTVNSEIIVETAKIIDAPVQQVETMLGSSIETLSLGIGAAEEIPGGGESRTYQVDKYTIWVTYDTRGIAKGLQIVDGLLDDGYSLDQWGIILTRIGVDFVRLPDIEAPAARRWTNANGYAIMIAAEKIDGNVWTVRIYKIP
jgi:hypothetical protein